MSDETLEPRIFAVLRGASGKLTVFQIATKLNMEKDRKVVSKLCGALEKQSKLIKTGAGKGTYYELSTINQSPQHEKPPTSQARDKVLVAVNAGNGLRLNEVCKAASVEPMECRALLIDLLATNEIKSHGVRAQTRYYALNGELRIPKGKLDADPIIDLHLRRAENGGADNGDAESPEVSEPVREKVTAAMAVDWTIESLKVGRSAPPEPSEYRLTPNELAVSAINTYCNGDGYLPAIDYAYSLVRRRDARLFSGWDNAEGRRIVVWRPRPGEERPDPSAVISLITGKAVK